MANKQLVRTLGLAQILMLGIGGTMGAGVFVLHTGRAAEGIAAEQPGVVSVVDAPGVELVEGAETLELCMITSLAASRS